MELVSDWLHEIIFRRVSELWSALIEQSDDENLPPNRLDVREYAGFDGPNCSPPVLHAWKYDADGLQSVPIPSTVDTAQGRRGMFFEIGTVHFHVMKDRPYIVLETLVGPKYGGGYVYRVIGQGTEAKLEVDPRFGMWAS